MNMACVKFGLTPEEAWAGVTRHAAQALGRQNSHGQLAAGFVADFAIWDAEHPVEMVYEPGRSPLWHRVVRGENAMTLWQPTPADIWQGRDDSAEAANALRLFQTIVRAERFAPQALPGDIGPAGVRLR
ncbi:Imidazolonepropionase [Raoultella planticola]|uniref:Imidazolonepropionase n=1 Tax=Raoultella planticola TaxID=575 RepID=A0A485AUK8_RAOPL|nr:Imidazolonepropionase [Raoultella planticola]